MNFMNPPNTQNPAQNSNIPQPSGFLSPVQNAGKPSPTVFSSPLGSNVHKTAANTVGAPTLLNWPTSTTAPAASSSLANFKPSSNTTSVIAFNENVPAQNKSIVPSTNAVTNTAFRPTTMNYGLTTTSQPAMGANTFRIPVATKPATTASPTASTFSTVKPTTTSAISLSQPSTAVSATTTQPLSIASTTSTSSTPLTSSALSGKVAPSNTAAQPLTFQQMEELILNKWTAELYEQEKVFLNQATQINIWDKIINENAEKLTQLHSTMEKVRRQQTKINDDLEVISSHQKDLETCLVPLEKEDLLTVLKADPNRKNLYSNAKNIDTQIKSMSENLKETIEHINETSRTHDTDDPVIQIGRILNAHMESLRWIDEHTARMQDYFDSLLKIHDDLRRECDLSKHDIY